jgi:hypothetical protein
MWTISSPSWPLWNSSIATASSPSFSFSRSPKSCSMVVVDAPSSCSTDSRSSRSWATAGSAVSGAASAASDRTPTTRVIPTMPLPPLLSAKLEASSWQFLRQTLDTHVPSRN